MHTEDDSIIPFGLAKKLASAASAVNKNVTLKIFPATLGYKHSFHYRDEDFPQLIMDLMKL